MVFVCVCIRVPNGTSFKFLKQYYGRTVPDADQTLMDLFNNFASGEFDSKSPIDDKYQTVEVSAFSVVYTVY